MLTIIGAWGVEFQERASKLFPGKMETREVVYAGF
jgi:hypothetical protein